MIFKDSLGIKDLQFGLNHGLYTQESSGTVFSWGDNTFGQTGNNYSPSFKHLCHHNENKDKENHLKKLIT